MMRIPAPMIVPITDSGPRPLWSVMIPTYNCASFLRQTLASVLAQAPQESVMQIEVIDDCSTQDDPQSVVSEVGQGRVTFHRNATNQGAIPTFNTCIQRAQGEWVHILHGDDFVLPGFYEQVTSAVQTHPGISLVVTRVQMVTEQAAATSISPPLPALAQPSQDARPFFHENPFRTPGVVVRRQFYEQHGGFLPPLIHVADWELWVRAIHHGGGIAIDRPLAAYRSFDANHSHRILRSAENLHDWERLRAHWTALDLPGFDLARFDRALADASSEQSFAFLRRGDQPAARAAAKCFIRHARPSKLLLEACRFVYRWLLGQFHLAR
jgi:glycosyltransferase involved in cell wall biosynthesis